MTMVEVLFCITVFVSGFFVGSFIDDIIKKAKKDVQDSKAGIEVWRAKVITETEVMEFAFTEAIIQSDSTTELFLHGNTVAFIPNRYLVMVERFENNLNTNA
jgi:hypothetical protein